MLGSNLRYHSKRTRIYECLGVFLSQLKVMLPENGLLWGGAIFAGAYLGWRIWRGKEEVSDRILLWWAFWSFAVLWVSGTFYGHYFLQIIASFSVLAAYGIIATWKWIKSLSSLFRFVAQGVWTILLVIMVTLFIKTDYKYFFSYTPVGQTVFQRHYSDGTFDVSYGIYNIVQQEFAFYIRDHTDPSETLYVWGIAPQVYFLAQRKAATRYICNSNMSFLVTNNSLKALEAYAPTVMEDIRKSPPAYIVEIFRLEDFPELQTFVRDQYMVERSVELQNQPVDILSLPETP